MRDMIHGINFAPFGKKGSLSGAAFPGELYEALSRTGADTVIFCPGALQKTAHTESIRFAEGELLSDEELINAIQFAHYLGKKVFLKPTVNCEDGTWRAYISFFDHAEPGEATWENWFAAYTAFQMHYAKIAEKMGVECFIAGCEMVQTEHRESQWRELFACLRGVYHGILSYNTDKYQEEYVPFWDAVDWIGVSGYYPAGDWERELDRIEKVSQKVNRPVFFAEFGCMSTRGSAKRPNNWELQEPVSLEEQAAWYDEALSAMEKRSFVAGAAVWEIGRGEQGDSSHDRGYRILGKPAEIIVRRHYSGGNPQ